MASPWGKFLAPITIDSSNQTFGFDDGNARTADIAAATYGSILEVLAALKTAMDAASTVTFTMACSATGIVTITGDGSWTWTAGTTDDALEAILGLAGSESVSSNVLTATNQHRYGWYPGVTTFGSASGTGTSADSGWVPDDTEESAMTGSGQACIIQPDRDIHSRRLTFDIIKRTEREHPYTGVAMLERYARTKECRWYPDRDDGAVGSVGTQGDPEDDPRDSSCDYWLVTLNERPNVQRGQGHPDHFIVSLDMNGEPD